MSEMFPGRPTHHEIEGEFFARLQRQFPAGHEEREVDRHAFVVATRAVEYVRANRAQIVVRFFLDGAKTRHMPWVRAEGAAAYAPSLAAAFLSGLEDLQRMHGYAAEPWLEVDAAGNTTQVLLFPDGQKAHRTGGAETFTLDPAP